MDSDLLEKKINDLKFQYTKISHPQSKQRMEEYISSLEKELEEKKKVNVK